MYSTPNEFYYRIHHIRPRFKNNVEDVIINLSSEIVSIGIQKEGDFKEEFNERIKRYADNALKSEKTINNWRTEISSLFSLYMGDGTFIYPADITRDLVDSGNLEKFFIRFMSTFQYPGGHLKNHEIKKMIDCKIAFHPARWILKFLISANSEKSNYITASEFCHCVLNDLRVTRDGEDLEITRNRILHNRKTRASYDSSGDVVRYASDLLDYLKYGGLLCENEYTQRFYLKGSGFEIAQKIASSDYFFEDYASCEKLEDIENLRHSWFSYVNSASKDLISENQDSPTEIEVFNEISTSNSDLDHVIALKNNELDNTKKIGDLGEAMVLIHEKIFLQENGRPDLAKRVTLLPNHLAMGYDINSRFLNDSIKCIEVKTTISVNPVQIRKFHLTSNEWSAAESFREKYFVYRIQISEKEVRLFVMKDPVGLYKSDRISISIRDGVDVTYSEESGEYFVLKQI